MAAVGPRLQGREVVGDHGLGRRRIEVAGGVQDHQRHALRITAREGDRELRTGGCAIQADRPESERVEGGRDALEVVVQRLGARRGRVGQTVARCIQRKDAEVLREFGGEWQDRLAGEGRRVQQHDGRALARSVVMDLAVAYGQEPGLQASDSWRSIEDGT